MYHRLSGYPTARLAEKGTLLLVGGGQLWTAVLQMGTMMVLPQNACCYVGVIHMQAAGRCTRMLAPLYVRSD
jgi:hypothetical protein